MSLAPRDRPSPNHDARPPGAPIDTLVIHYTGMRTAAEALARLADPAAKVSAHYVIEEDGTIWRMVDEARRAWHAGVSAWRGRRDLNDVSIGIELVNPGHEWGYRPFPVLQLAALTDLALALLARHPIAARNILAHSDIAPARKQDPGELFDWQALAANGVGLWPQGVGDAGPGGAARDAAALAPVRAALRAVGYAVAPEGGLDPALAAVLRAFQRHWRPEAVTGQADDGTRLRLAAVAAMVGVS
ncbi:MAG: N-acetylmuramoyl-L-alanine amidase [Acetobacteraceae bacterium]